MLEAIGHAWAPSRWAVIRDARRRQRRRHRRLFTVGAIVLLIAALGWVIAGNPGAGHAPTVTGVTVGPVEQLHLGGVVLDTTTLGGKVWALTCVRRCSQASSARSAGELVEITSDGRPIKRSAVADPTALAGGGGAIWIVHFDTGEVSRIDPQTGRTTATAHLQLPSQVTTTGRAGFHPLGVSVGAGRIWASSALGYVAEIDPRTARLQRMVFTSSEVTSATTAGGLTWVADELDGVGAFAAGSDRVATHPISWARQPVDVETVAYGAGLIWALGTETNFSKSLTDPPTVGVLTTLDPRTGRIVDQWQVSAGASALVLGHGGAYVSDDNNGRLLSLTPSHGIKTLNGPKAAKLTAVTSNALWEIDRSGHLLRIGLTGR